MSKYKLIKWYPKLPKEWKSYKADIIATKCSCYNYIADMTQLSECEVEENPEFWEKVVEKQYEILKIKGNYTGSVHIYNKMKNIGNDSHDFSIYQIKRLSDGEVFTVGDKIYWDWAKADVDYFTIDKLYLDEDNVLRFDTKESSGQKFRLDKLDFIDYDISMLDRLKHYKPEPLFTTEDGVDIYEGDKFCIINSDYNRIFHRVGGDGLNYESEQVRKRCFSTTAVAEDWIDLNKPKYSKKKIKDSVHKVGHIGFKNTPEGSEVITLLSMEDLFKELDI